MSIGAQMELEQVTKYYKKFKAVDDVSLSIEPGEFLTILGPSGSGKTSLLKLIAGFEPLSQGKVLLNGEDISTKPPYLRNVGMLFQNYALFPHMTVFENVAYPLKVRKLDKGQIQEKVEEILELVQLTEFSDRYPKQLSGGQQQRVALARAIVFNPPVLLLDEPLGALDKNLRQSMQLEIKRIQEQIGITTISVTHDQEEALTMSDRICVMKDGRIMQVDTPENLYKRPQNRFVAEFIGEINLINGKLARKEENIAYISFEDQIISPVQQHDDVEITDDEVCIAIRPEDIRITEPHASYDTILDVIVTEFIYVGEALKIKARTPFGKYLNIKVPSYLADQVRENETLSVGWDACDATLVVDDARIPVTV